MNRGCAEKKDSARVVHDLSLPGRNWPRCLRQTGRVRLFGRHAGYGDEPTRRHRARGGLSPGGDHDLPGHDLPVSLRALSPGILRSLGPRLVPVRPSTWCDYQLSGQRAMGLAVLAPGAHRVDRARVPVGCARVQRAGAMEGPVLGPRRVSAPVVVHSHIPAGQLHARRGSGSPVPQHRDVLDGRRPVAAPPPAGVTPGGDYRSRVLPVEPPSPGLSVLAGARSVESVGLLPRHSYSSWRSVPEFCSWC